MDIKGKYIRRGIRTASVNCKDLILVILLSKDGDPTLFKLSQDGILIWRMLEENRKTEEIINEIVALKNKNFHFIKSRLITYIRKLARINILDIIENPEKEYY